MPNRTEPIWIDLQRPTADEEALVESEHGIRIPTHAQLQEIETSSRLRVEGETLLMSMPLGLQDNRFANGPLPLGFVLTPNILVTVRYCDIHAFPDVQAALLAQSRAVHQRRGVRQPAGGHGRFRRRPTRADQRGSGRCIAADLRFARPATAAATSASTAPCSKT